VSHNPRVLVLSKLSMYLFWLPANIVGSYCFLKVALRDRMAIEKSYGSQLAMLTSLAIRQNSYTRHVVSRDILF